MAIMSRPQWVNIWVFKYNKNIYARLKHFTVNLRTLLQVKILIFDISELTDDLTELVEGVA